MKISFKKLIRNNPKKDTQDPSAWYRKFVEDSFDLIYSEMLKYETSGELPGMYPKLIIMYRYFRLLRGEAFFNTIQMRAVGDQRKFYYLEDTLAAKLRELKSTIDPENFSYNNAMGEFEKLFKTKPLLKKE